MRKLFLIFLLVATLSLAGCQMKMDKIKDMEGVPMVPAKYACDTLGLTYADKDGGFVIIQDDIKLEFDFSNSYVYKDKNIMYVMEKPAVEEKGVAYLPISFFSDYFRVDIQKGDGLSETGMVSLYKIVKFLPGEVIGAIKDKSYPNRDKILEAVEMPRSMGIQIPNINMDKVINTTPLSEYSSGFKTELSQHGLSEKEIAGLSYSDYEAIERSWKLTKEMTESVKKSYPELADTDLSNWTYGDYQDYYTKKDKENFENEFTKEQITQLKQRRILLEDVHWLFKDFYKIDVILAQPEEVLKRTIEGYYQLKLDFLASQ